MHQVLQQKVPHVRHWPELQRIQYSCLLQKWNYHYQDRIDKIFLNTGRINLPITFEPLENYFTGFSFDYYSFDNKDVNGLMDGHWEQKGGKVSVYYANNCVEARQRFTIAHELMHFYQFNDLEFKQELEAIKYNIVREKLLDRVADKAAGYYLAPKPLVEAVVRTMTLEELAAYFNISTQAMDICLKDYRLDHLAVKEKVYERPW